MCIRSSGLRKPNSGNGQLVGADEAIGASEAACLQSALPQVRAEWVRAAPLDALLRPFVAPEVGMGVHWCFRVIKLDLEGYEERALQSGARALGLASSPGEKRTRTGRGCRPCAVFVELRHGVEVALTGPTGDARRNKDQLPVLEDVGYVGRHLIGNDYVFLDMGNELCRKAWHYAGDRVG